jgi:hypothetical protein
MPYCLAKAGRAEAVVGKIDEIAKPISRLRTNLKLLK